MSIKCGTIIGDCVYVFGPKSLGGSYWMNFRIGEVVPNPLATNEVVKDSMHKSFFMHVRDVDEFGEIINSSGATIEFIVCPESRTISYRAALSKRDNYEKRIGRTVCASRKFVTFPIKSDKITLSKYDVLVELYEYLVTYKYDLSNIESELRRYLRKVI